MRRLAFIGLLVLASVVEAHGIRQDYLAELSHSIKHEPNNIELRLSRGRVYSMQSRWLLAQQDFEKVLTVQPNNSDALIALGKVHFSMGALSAAQSYLERYLRGQPSSVQGYAVLARIHMKQKAYVSATSYFEQAVSKDQNPTPQMFLEWYRAQIKVIPFNKSRVQAVLFKGMAQHGPLVTFLALMVELNITTEDYSIAHEWLNKYPVNLRETPQWQLQLAKLKTLNKEWDQAYYTYSQLINHINRLPLHKANVPAVQGILKKAKALRKALPKAFIER